MLRIQLTRIFIWLCVVTASAISTANAKGMELKVLQMNIWQEGTMVKGGFEAIADEVSRLEPDIVMFSEIRNYHGKMFITRILQALKERGKTYYGENSPLDVGVLSKYPIEEQAPNCPSEKDAGSVLKTRIRINDKTVVVYSAHLDYTHYACYLPRGYSGVTWKKLDAPVTDSAEVEKANRESMRDEAIYHFIEDSKKENGNIILLGGDFNEPSHLDWSDNTKDLWDHHGTVVRWDCSTMLAEAGFKDAYRTKYPNPVTHPGFTFPSDNEGVAEQKLSWAPEADERDRIDFVYFKPIKGLKVKDAVIVGPSKSIVRSKRTEENSRDRFVKPLGVWPTDHKAVMITFYIK